MKFVFMLVVIQIGIFVFSETTEELKPLHGRLWTSLKRSPRSQNAGINYGFPTFPDFGNQHNFPTIGQGGRAVGGLFSRSDFSDFMPDPSQFKNNQGWTSKSCVYDEKGTAKCVEQSGGVKHRL
ncbi:uncharacterized protein LOC128722160 isoform X2 [Anopheles nili]|uniref:uncharacterized protein LOC128722160 isoform X2 n=1 Tax=Anopheles nili TaxID=185578 RepID=UPI00237A793D|nr:uncharacterized protein LOC128722160 isoform X2 [Anopheles nili]